MFVCVGWIDVLLISNEIVSIVFFLYLFNWYTKRDFSFHFGEFCMDYNQKTEKTFEN